MTDQKNINQVVRELKCLDVKESDSSILNEWELRGRNVNEELHASSTTPLVPRPSTCTKNSKNLRQKKLSLLPPISQLTPALVSAVSPQSSSDLNTDQGKAVDETIGKVVELFNQTLLMTIGGIHNSNIGSKNDSHDKIVDRQPASTLNTNDKQGESLSLQKNSYQLTQLTKLGQTLS